MLNVRRNWCDAFVCNGTYNTTHGVYEYSEHKISSRWSSPLFLFYVAVAACSGTLCPCPTVVMLCSVSAHIHIYTQNTTDRCVPMREIIITEVESNMDSRTSSCYSLVFVFFDMESSYRADLLSTFVDSDHVTKTSHICGKCAYGTFCTINGFLFCCFGIFIWNCFAPSSLYSSPNEFSNRNYFYGSFH